MKAKDNFDKAIKHIKRKGIEDLINWLETKTDFFIAPASTNFHGNYEGGLLEHSINVLRFALHNFNLIVKEKPDLEYLRESVIICALFHDVCKTNFYKKEQKWTKVAGQWKSYEGWIVNDDFPLGHGEKSVFLISKYIELTNAEAMAIRWHMGTTEPSVTVPNNPQYYSYNQAIDHPLVRLISSADELAMTIEEARDLKNM